jgi:hypothetical protein
VKNTMTSQPNGEREKKRVEMQKHEREAKQVMRRRQQNLEYVRYKTEKVWMMNRDTCTKRPKEMRKRENEVDRIP